MANTSSIKLPAELPVLPLRQSVLFPLTLQPLAADRPVSVESVHRALGTERMLFLTLEREEADDPQPADLSQIGTVGIVRQMAKSPTGVHIIVEGVARAAGVISRTDLVMTAAVTARPEQVEKTLEVDAYVRSLKELIDRAMNLTSGLSQELRAMVMSIDDPLRLVYLLGSLLDMKPEDKQKLLEEDRLLVKLQAVSGVLNREIALLELKGKIESQAQQEMTDAQRQVLPAPAAEGDPGGARREGGGRNRRTARADRQGEPARARGDGRGARGGAAGADDAGLARVPDDPHLSRLGAGRPVEHDHRGPARSGRGPARAGRGPLRPRQGEGADCRVPRRAQAEGGHAGADPLLRGSPRRRQDVARPVDRARDEPEVRPDLARRRARRSGDPGPPAHVHRRPARGGSSRR